MKTLLPARIVKWRHSACPLRRFAPRWTETHFPQQKNVPFWTRAIRVFFFQPPRTQSRNTKEQRWKRRKQKVSLSIHFIILLQNRFLIIQSSLRPPCLVSWETRHTLWKLKALSLNAPKHFCKCPHEGAFFSQLESNGMFSAQLSYLARRIVH